MTKDDFDRLLASQDGRCAICNDPMISELNNRSRPSVDHEHISGRVRALLCAGCNLMIGYAKERPEVLVAASKYLRP